MKIKNLALIIGLLGAAITTPAQSTLVNVTDSKPFNISNFGSLGGTTSGYQYQVLTGGSSGTSWQLDGLTISSFAAFSSDTPASYTFTLNLYNDNHNSPGTQIGSAISPTSVSAVSQFWGPYYDFTVSFDLTAADAVVPGGSSFWYSVNQAGGGMANMFMASSTANYGNGWGTGCLDAAGSYVGNDTTALTLTGTIEPTPEPSTLALAGLGGLSLLVLRRITS